MTLRELREKTAKYNNPDLLNKLSVTINYPQINFSTTLTGLATIYQFVLQQVKGWNELDNLPIELLLSKQYFEGIKNNIIKLISRLESFNEDQIKNEWQ